MRLAPGTEVLVLFGSEDTYGPTTQRLFARYPDARRVVLKGTGHLPWLQSPETFREELCAFFGCRSLGQSGGGAPLHARVRGTLGAW